MNLTLTSLTEWFIRLEELNWLSAIKVSKSPYCQKLPYYYERIQQSTQDETLRYVVLDIECGSNR
jgi:hypothetical protein